MPAKWSNASSALESLRVTSSRSLRRRSVMSPLGSSLLTAALCLRCNDRSSRLSTSLLSPAASNTPMSSGRTKASSSASSASSSLFRSVLTLLASGLYVLDGSWPDGVLDANSSKRELKQLTRAVQLVSQRSHVLQIERPNRCGHVAPLECRRSYRFMPMSHKISPGFRST